MKMYLRNPAAWAGVIQAIVALVATYVKGLPVEAILGLIAAATGLSFHAQRVEDAKTDTALYTEPEDWNEPEDQA